MTKWSCTVEPDLGLGLGRQSGHCLTGLVGHIQVQVSIVMILFRHYVRKGGGGGNITLFKFANSLKPVFQTSACEMGQFFDTKL